MVKCLAQGHNGMWSGGSWDQTVNLGGQTTLRPEPQPKRRRSRSIHSIFTNKAGTNGVTGFGIKTQGGSPPQDSKTSCVRTHNRDPDDPPPRTGHQADDFSSNLESGFLSYLKQY